MSPQAPAPLTGLVIAGGSSSRMGRDKLTLTLRGEPWWSRQARLLRAAGADSVWLSRRPGQSAPAGVPCIHDLYTNVGPLAGLQAALCRAPRGLVAVLAVDMPLVGGDWFPRLLARCGAGAGAAFVHEGFFEPLAAVYPTAALALVERRLQAGELSLQGLCRALQQRGLLQCIPLPAGLGRGAESINTPELLGQLQAPGRCGSRDC